MKTNKKDQEKMLDAYFGAARRQKKLLSDDEVQSIIRDRLVMYQAEHKTRISRTFKILITMSLVSIISIGLYCLLPNVNPGTVQHQAQTQAQRMITPGEPPAPTAKNIKPKPKAEINKYYTPQNDGDNDFDNQNPYTMAQTTNPNSYSPGDTIRKKEVKMIYMNRDGVQLGDKKEKKRTGPVVYADSSNYELPDLAEFYHVDAKSKTNATGGENLNPDFNNIRMNSVKTISLSKKQLANMGVYTSKSGVFVDQGNGLILCFNHKGFNLHPVVGKSMKSFPMMITDESGKDYPITMKIEIKMIDKTISNNKIDSMVQNKTFVLQLNKKLAEINTLVPIVVNNNSDTTEGNVNNKIILWYKADDAQLDNLPAPFLSQIRKESEKVECKMTTKCVDTIKSIVPTYFEAAKNNTLTMNELLVYPNPATEKVNVSFNLAEDKELTINLFSITGQLIKTMQGSRHYNKGMNNMEFDINEPSGLYLINIQSSKNETWTQRLMIKKQ